MNDEEIFDRVTQIKYDCEHYQRLAEQCVLTQGRCLTGGNNDLCKTAGYYARKINSQQPKTFRERFPDWQEWRA